MNVFSENPIKVFIKGFDANRELYTKTIFVFLNVPVDIYKEIIAVSEKPRQSPKLKAFFGNNWASKLNIEGTVGGNNDDDLELLEELLEEESAPDDIFGIEEVETHPEPKPIVESGIINYINDVFIFPEDRVSEFKDKIHIIADIPMFRQHMYLLRGGIAMPISYRTTVDGVISIDIRNLYTSGGDIIFDIPLDTKFNQNRDIIRIEEYDELKTMGELFEISSKFYIIDLDDFISRDRRLLAETARTDTFKLEMLYYGFIIKYFPQISLGAFKDYLVNESVAKTNYPRLFRSRKTLRTKYDAEAVIINNSYKIDLLKPISEQIDIGIRSATITVDKLRLFSHASVINRGLELNIRNLFDILHLSNVVPMTKTRLIYNNQDIVLTKVYKKQIYRPMSNYKLMFYNTLAVLLKISANKYAILTFFESGKYNIRVVWGENSDMNFDQTFNMLEPKVNMLINIINGFGRRVFNTSERLSEMKKFNSEFTELNIDLFWRKVMIESVFHKLLALLKDYYISGIFQDKSGSITEFALFKGVTKFDVRRLERNMVVNNYYEHLTDPKIKQRWDFVFGRGRAAEILHRATDIRVEIRNIREQEFEIFYRYIMNMFHTLTENVKPEDFVPKDTKVEVGKNRLKRLKTKDPVLFQLKDKGAGQLYSKKCQKPHQPVIYSPTEIMFLPKETQRKLVKYWNFTTNSPAYYLCPEDKNPYLGFITGIHKDDLCIPCCKKADPIKAEASKKIHVYNICIDKKRYSEADSIESMSRYIMSYGKDIEPERLGQPPKLLFDFLTFNTDIGSKAVDQLRSPNFYLIGVLQHAKGIENIGAIYSLAQVLNLTPEAFVKEISKYIQANRELFFEHRNYPLNEIVDILDADFVSEAPWNDIIINAVKYKYGIYTLQIRDETGAGSSFNLDLPEKVDYINNFISERFEESSRKYTILLKRRDKTNTGKFLYFPLSVIRPREFFHDGAVDQIIYAHTDEIMELFRTMVMKLITKPTSRTRNKIDLKILSDFIESEKNIKFLKKYVNTTDMCYAVLLEHNKDKVYFPISYSSYQRNDKDIEHGAVMLRKHKLKYKALLSVVDKYNKYVFGVSEYKTDDGKTIPAYPIIKPKRFLVYKNIVIGFTYKGLNYYFTDGKRLPKSNNIKYTTMLYHPDDVNNAIINSKPADPSKELGYALYERYLYDLFVAQIISYFESSRNKVLRGKIVKIISGANYQNNSEIEKKLRELLPRTDFIKMRGEIQNIEGKKNFLENFNKSVYEFDRVEYTQMLELPRDKIREKLIKIAKQITSSGTPKIKHIDNIMPVCGNDADYCTRGKLIIPAKKIPILAEALSNDISNPLKRDYILQYMFVRNVADFAEFEKRLDETIYLDII